MKSLKTKYQCYRRVVDVRNLNTERLNLELYWNNLKQRDLAKKVGVTEVSMSRYFNGSRMPRKDILYRIAKALNTTPEYLTDTEAQENPDVAFAQVRVAIKTYGEAWTLSQKKELINNLIDVLSDEFLE